MEASAFTLCSPPAARTGGVTASPPSLFDRLWPAAGALLLLVALLGSVLWWRAAGPVQVKGERVVTSRAVRQPAPGEPPQLLALDRQLGPGDYAWNADGVTGRPWIVVDLASRELHAFRGLNGGRARRHPARPH